MKTSYSHKLLVLTLAVGGLLAQTASALITIETVPVGNAGNAADPLFNHGAVGYDYRIGKYEVTLNQYTAFLNAVAKTDTYGLYNTQLGATAWIMGISRSGASGSYTYSVIGSGARPVTYVSWYDVARFVNWLGNGQPVGAQAAGTTETGAYTLTGNTGTILRNPTATYGLPSTDEWCKAAYHQPAAQGGDADNYWQYPTANNAIPNSRFGSASDTNSANFYWDDGIANGFNGGYAINNSTVLPTGNALTDAGAFSLADSYYGTFDQGGNVREWTEGIPYAAVRSIGGGSWDVNENTLRAGTWTNLDPATEGLSIGFRVVLLSVAAPPVLNLSQSGNTLRFSWTGNFKLQAQTNSLSSGIGTNWSDYPSGGSSPVIAEIDPASSPVFFRLSMP